MEYCKVQICAMLTILYVLFVNLKEKKRFGQKYIWTAFEGLLLLGVVSVLFDGLTAYTVNHLETISDEVNMMLHMCFLISLDSFIFGLFIYMVSITNGLSKKKWKNAVLYTPFLINVIVVIVNMPSLEYRHGEISNFSMGISAYTCFVMAGVYILLSMAIFLSSWRYIEQHKRWSIFTYLLMLAGITGYQMLHPQSLLSSFCVTIIILGVYMNQENPTVAELSHYHNEMIMGFAVLVENKDGSTYARYWKIAVPDVILQKPGKLTEEEFEVMKGHTVSGGKIIRETFEHLGNEQYAQIAYEVAMYHHEKWNGKGYPEGLKRKEIPLSARIMAIADVFDAVSEKRCYRDAMPLDKCFEIIEEGSGQDFDPVLVEIFLGIREQVEQIHREFVVHSEEVESA